MKIITRLSNFKLVLALLALTVVKCEAKPGDIIHTESHSYRVAGWEHELVNASPNLVNYHWEPMSRIVNTTRTTSRQAEAAPPGFTQNTHSRYIKPIHLPMPCLPQPEVEKNVQATLRTQPTRLQYQAHTQPVLTYTSTDIAWQNKGRDSNVKPPSTREMVYGVLKYSSAKSKAQSL